MKINKNIAISETGFVFDPTTGDSYSLNPVGLEILQLLMQEKSYETITGIIISKYEVEPDVFERYLLDFVAILKQMNLAGSHE
jgi:hypothetical protein